MKIIKKDNKYLVEIEASSDETILDKLNNNSFKLMEVTKDVFAMVFAGKSASNVGHTNPIVSSTSKQKICALLNDRDLDVKDKVEGKFEELLNSKELSTFKDMLKKKEIILFKLSSKYKKAIYKISEQSDLNPKPKSSSVQSDDVNDFAFFKKNNYIIISNPGDANKFAEMYGAEIKANNIIGIKSFDSNYYVITSGLFNEYKDKILILDLNIDFSLMDVSSKLNIDEELLKIILELLKEEGLVIEKRKGIYQLI